MVAEGVEKASSRGVGRAGVGQAESDRRGLAGGDWTTGGKANRL